MNNTTSTRSIDQLAKDVYLWIKKTKMSVWQTSLLIAFLGGLALFASGPLLGTEEAELSIIPENLTVNEGEQFTLQVMLNTDNTNVVSVRSIIEYDPQVFDFISYDTANSVFEQDNSCVYENESCRIIDIDEIGGKIDIVLAKPSTGVDVVDGNYVNLTFKALIPISPTAKNILLNYTGYQDYTDSDVIADDGEGTDFLKYISGAMVTVNDITPPSIPTNLIGSALSSSEISLNWTVSTDNVSVTGYNIYRSLDGINFSNINSSPSTSYTDNNLQAATIYYYYVTAYDAAGNESPASNIINKTTQEENNCGDGYCAGSLEGEDCATCPEDCVSGQGGSCSACWKGRCDGSCNSKKETSECADCASSYCCGDGVCSSGEDGNNCPVDCACSVDTDCNDNESCTTDVCNNGICENTWPACGLSDGCCGPLCTSSNDSDCTNCSPCFKGVCDGVCHPKKENASCPDCQ